VPDGTPPRDSGRDYFTSRELIQALIDINQPDARVITEVDLDGDVHVGSIVRRVSYDGFHRAITISGVLSPPLPKDRRYRIP
jgi:hypothetical protein